MRARSLVLLLAALLLLPFAALAKGKKSRLVTNYQRVKDYTTIRTPTLVVKRREKWVTAKAEIVASYGFSGRTPSRPKWIAFVIMGTRPLGRPDSWSRETRFYFRWGNKPVSYPAEYNVASVGASIVEDYVACAIPVDDFNEMLQQKEFSLQVGTSEYTVNGTNMERLRELGRSIPAANLIWIPPPSDR